MAGCLRDRKRITQPTVNSLFAFYKLARYYDYSEDEAKRVAVLSVEAGLQGGAWHYEVQAIRISQHTTHGGKETAETFDRLTAGRVATEEINLWYIDGVHVNEQIVKYPETQTVKQINAEQNSEIKRICIERFGWELYLRESNAKVLDVRDNDIDMTKESLMEVEYKTETSTWDNVKRDWIVKTHNKIRVLVCACPSTARVYTMRVPRSIGSCEQAQQWVSRGLSLRTIGAS